MRKHSRQGGMTLVEVAAGTVIVATSLLGTAAAVISGASLSQEVGRIRASARAASSVVEEIRAADFAEIKTSFDGAVRDIATAESGLERGTATISVAKLNNGAKKHSIYEITIVITFGDADVTQTQTIVTYASDRVAGSGLSRKR